MEYRSDGVPECWSTGVLEYCAGMNRFAANGAGKVIRAGVSPALPGRYAAIANRHLANTRNPNGSAMLSSGQGGITFKQHIR
jgi:hypothetical protein